MFDTGSIATNFARGVFLTPATESPKKLEGQSFMSKNVNLLFHLVVSTWFRLGYTDCTEC